MSLDIDVKFVRLISGRLRNFKQKRDNLFQLSCPICGDSHKNKTKARGYVYQKGSSLFYACHNCGASTTLGNLIKTVDPSLFQEYILERYKTGKSNVRTSIATTIEPVRFDRIEKTRSFAFAEYCDSLPESHFCITYLKNRKIPIEHYKNLLYAEKYKDFIDNLVPDHGKEIVNDKRLVIPYYDAYGELIAVSGRALENANNKLRYITVRTDKSDEKLIYGLDRVDFKRKIKIVEGPIDSLFLDNCVASGDGNLAIAAQRLIQLGAKKENLVLISDNEPRNKEIVKLIEKSVKEEYNVCIWPDNIAQKDINDMVVSGRSVKTIESIISNRTASGIEALLMFNFWKKV